MCFTLLGPSPSSLVRSNTQGWRRMASRDRDATTDDRLPPVRRELVALGQQHLRHQLVVHQGEELVLGA